MTFNEFNSIVDMPQLVAARLDRKDLQFKRLPTYGWFAYDPAGKAYNLRDLFPGMKLIELYRELTQNNLYLEVEVTYSQRFETRLQNDMVSTSEAEQALAQAIQHMQEGHGMFFGRTVPYKDMLAQEGMPGFQLQRCGVVDWAIVQKHKVLQGKQVPGRHCLLVPRWHTPNHINQLELVSVSDTTDRRVVWTMGDHGWYGELSDMLVTGISDLGQYVGFTWSRVGQEWREIIGKTQPLQVPDTISTAGLVAVWRDAAFGVKFMTPPEELLQKRLHTLSDCMPILKEITYSQSRELGELTGLDIAGAWQRKREVSCQVGHRVVSRRGDTYWQCEHSGARELTNFAVELRTQESRGRKGNQSALWSGSLVMNGVSTPIELSTGKLMTGRQLMATIVEAQVFGGLGVPYADPNCLGYLGYAILKLNPAVTMSGRPAAYRGPSNGSSKL